MFRWTQARPVPVKVSECAGTSWHVVDPGGALKPAVNLPAAAKFILRGIHLSGTADGIALIEAQTRLPGWMLRILPVNGFTHGRSPWDLCLIRDDHLSAVKVVRNPVRQVPDSISAWLPGNPLIQVVLTGSNPFRFSSFCPGEAVAAPLPGPAEGATLFLSGGRSPHMTRFLPGITPERVEAGPDWADISLMNEGHRRTVRWGAASGAPGKPLTLSLRFRYRKDAGGGAELIEKFIPRDALSNMVQGLEAECRPASGGEHCEGRLTLTF